MKIPKYPDDFYSFKNGVNISNDKINKWIKKCIDYLEENKESNVFTTSSGNTLVSVSRYYYDHKDDYYYDIVVTKNYSNTNTYDESK